MKRPLLVLAAGLIGLLLGIGLSLVADAIAGDDLSDPVPLGIATEPVRTTPTSSPRNDRPEATESPGDKGNDDHEGSSGSGSGETEAEATPSPEPTESHSEDGSGSDDDHSGGGSEGSGGDDD